MWDEAFWAQAKSDWEMYAKLDETREPACHVLHYLQMATEKLGKAYLMARGTDVGDVQTSHQAFTQFLRLAARNGKVQRKLGMTAAQLRAHVRRLLPIAHAVEKLAPALAAGSVNAEYPWSTPQGAIVAPIRHSFALSRMLEGANGRNLLKLVEAVLENFFYIAS